MDMRKVTVALGEDGRVAAVEVEGHPEPEGVVESTPSEPVRAFRDEEYDANPRRWLGA